MKDPKAYEKYPTSTVILYNLVALANYAVGLYLFYQISYIFSLAYLVYLAIVESSVYRTGCRYCYYYGKRCFSGRGSIAPLFIKKGDPKKFCEKEVTWKNLLPTMMTTVFPIFAGGYLLLKGVDWMIVGMIAVPIATWIFANPLIFGKLGCPHCKQGRICCPANDSFGKKVKKKNN